MVQKDAALSGEQGGRPIEGPWGADKQTWLSLMVLLEFMSEIPPTK